MSKNCFFDQFKVLRNKIPWLIRKYIRNISTKQLKIIEQRVVWRNLKTISNFQQTRQACLPNTIKIVDGRSVEGTLNILNELNKHFINIASIID